MKSPFSVSSWAFENVTASIYVPHSLILYNLPSFIISIFLGTLQNCEHFRLNLKKYIYSYWAWNSLTRRKWSNCVLFYKYIHQHLLKISIFLSFIIPHMIFFQVRCSCMFRLPRHHNSRTSDAFLLHQLT